jgi:hypothetical protein
MFQVQVYSNLIATALFKNVQLAKLSNNACKAVCVAHVRVITCASILLEKILPAEKSCIVVN